MSPVERLVSDLRDVLAEEVVDISVMELSQHSDQSIAETIAHQRAVTRIRALLGDLLVDDTWIAPEPCFPATGRQMTPDEYAAYTARTG